MHAALHPSIHLPPSSTTTTHTFHSHLPFSPPSFPHLHPCCACSDTACYIAKELGILSRERFDEYMRVKDTDAEARKHIVLQGSEIEAIPRETPGAVLKDNHVPREPELAKCECADDRCMEACRLLSASSA